MMTFNSVQEGRIVNQVHQLKGEDVEDIGFKELNEAENRVQEHPCLRRGSDGSEEMSVDDEQSPVGLRDTLQRMKIP